jgi:hypothetical protein
MHPPSHEEDPRKWVYPCRPPIGVSQNDTCNSYCVHHFSYFKIWDPYCFNSVAWASWATGLYLWSILRWKACHIQLLADNGERMVQRFQRRAAIVSDDTSSFLHSKERIKFVVDTSGWHTTLTGSTWKRELWSEVREAEEVWHKTGSKARLPGTTTSTYSSCPYFYYYRSNYYYYKYYYNSYYYYPTPPTTTLLVLALLLLLPPPLPLPLPLLLRLLLLLLPY